MPMKEPWKGQRILVTGGAGFLGSHVLRKLRERGADHVVAPRSADYDLRNPEHVERLYAETRPHLVIHLAARVGGIGANRAHPATFFYDNALMGVYAIEYARRHGVRKFVCVGTVCSYPKFTSVPFRERDLWNGYPEETNAPYGVAKKMLLTQLHAYRQEFGLNGIYLIPVNLYGPGDNFDPHHAHVIPALIRQCVAARTSGAARITAWGTGTATREFLYVEDAAEAIATAAERYEKPDPVNIGSGDEISIRDLATLIMRLVGYTGGIQWDANQPDGQPRRRLDTSCARQEFGWRARTTLQEGLRRTIDWFLSHGTETESTRPAALT
jgi:GDP-L-fucose synthase